MSESVPLAYADLKILEIEGPTIAGHTCKVVRVAAPGVDFDQLFGDIASRIESVPEMRWKLGGEPDAPAWVPDMDFRLDRHLVAHQDSAAIAGDELNGVVAGLFAERLDRSRPLWRIDVVSLDDGGSALIWRIHHALADGTTAMRFAREMLWVEPETPASAAAKKMGPARVREADNARRRAHLVKLFEHEFTRTREPSPFDGQIGTRRDIAFSSISLSELHDSAKAACGATLNDAVLSVVAGALRHWMEVHHEHHLGEVRVKVPVSLHHGDDDGGNRDSFFLVPLPLNEGDPVVRLREIHEETLERKTDHEAEELDTLLQRLGKTSARLQKYYSRFQANPRRFALNVSNVRGPHTDVTVLDVPVESVHSIAEIGERHALRIAVVSLGDQLCFGFCADPDLVTDLEVMAEGVEIEAERLAAAIRP